MVDSRAHLDLIEAAGGGPVRVCLDVDAGWWPLGGRIKVGVKRSPVRTPEQAAALAADAAARPGIELVGLMSYEAHIAGVGDAPPGRRAYGAAVRAMQRASARELAARRAAVVAAVRAVADLEFVNGGGTGSIERTAAEAAVTEVTAGSGLYGPTLFDAYRAFDVRPAALFALPVVRKPSPASATVLGGGYLASGAAGADRLPRPVLPRRPAPRSRRGRRRGADAGARPGRARPRAGRPGVVSSRQGRRAVRALRQPAPRARRGDRRRGGHLPRRGADLPVSIEDEKRAAAEAAAALVRGRDARRPGHRVDRALPAAGARRSAG